MRLDPRYIWIIAKREYSTRVKTKAFWLGTAAIPVLLGAMLFGPSLLIGKIGSQQRITIVDATRGALSQDLPARLAEALEKSSPARGRAENVNFEVETVPAAADAAAQRAELDRKVLDKELDAWIWLSPETLAKDRFEYHARSVSNWLTQSILERRISEVVRNERLRSAGFDLDQVSRLSKTLEIDPTRVSKDGSKAEGKGGMFLAMGLFFMLYTTLIVYGSQMLQGVLEEKGSRIIEVLASAIPSDALLVGKLLGVSAVAFTQIAAWLVTSAVLTAPGLAATLFVPGLDIPTLSLAMVVHSLLFSLLGFLLFLALYAMIGAAFNSLQEAQQFSGFVIMFIIVPVFFMMPILNDPGSKLAIALSLFPFFTPLMMMLRMAVEMPPLWQILAAYGVLVVAILVILWIAARVYRTGILMYGKKPTLPEIWRWVRYS